jgi:TonB family protein
MKKLLFVFIFILPLTLNAQNSSALEVHEVDSVAIPKGGYSFLEKFININRQIPYMARVAKVNGYVFVSGVVDEKGRISSVNIMKGLRADCDKEAIRVFSLFNAWKPALKNGKPVAQKVSYRILFRYTGEIAFVDGFQLEYLNSDYMPVDSKIDYSYLQKTKIDTLTGEPVGDIEFYKRNKLIASFKQTITKTNYTPKYPDEVKDTLLKMDVVRHLDQNETVLGEILTFFENGTLEERRFYDNGKASYPLTNYHRNGVIREYTQYIDVEKKKFRKTSWFLNGQIEAITEYETVAVPSVDKNSMSPMSFREKINIVEQWDNSGNQRVTDGNGDVVFKYYEDIENYELLIEAGKVENHQKQGVWTGKMADGFTSFKEFYKNGELEKGISYSVSGDSVTYSKDVEVNAQFKGGINGYTNYLIHNLKYPASAQRNNAEGKSYIQFVVCTDGSLCDFKILKSAGDISLDKEAMRVIQNSSGKWESGIQRGRKVRSKFTLPINFRLN